MLQWEHSAILLTCYKQELVLKTNLWSVFEWLILKTGFTVPLFHGPVIFYCEFLETALSISHVAKVVYKTLVVKGISSFLASSVYL